MGKLIDADFLYKVLEARCDGCKDKYKDFCYNCCQTSEFHDVIEGAPEAIVRCKDCIYLRKSDPLHPDTEWCQRLICGTVNPNFFCADGRRKEKPDEDAGN